MQAALHACRDHKARWQQVAAGARHRDVGCHGPPLFVGRDRLFYLDASTFFRIPLAHALLYGLVRLISHSSASCWHAASGWVGAEDGSGSQGCSMCCCTHRSGGLALSWAHRCSDRQVPMLSAATN